MRYDKKSEIIEIVQGYIDLLIMIAFGDDGT